MYLHSHPKNTHNQGLPITPASWYQVFSSFWLFITSKLLHHRFGMSFSLFPQNLGVKKLILPLYFPTYYRFTTSFAFSHLQVLLILLLAFKEVFLITSTFHALILDKGWCLVTKKKSRVTFKTSWYKEKQNHQLLHVYKIYFSFRGWFL